MEKINLSTYDNKQKLNYVKNLIFKNNLTDTLDILLKDEQKNLEITNIILESLNDELITKSLKEQYCLADYKDVKIFVYSKIVSTLEFYNKSVILSSFLRKLNEEEKRNLAIYEYKNKTDVSLNSKIFNKYCLKYKNEALNSNNTEVLMLTSEIKKYNNNSIKKAKKTKKIIIFSILLITLISFVVIYNIINDLQAYDNLIYPGIYLNKIDLTRVKISDLESIVLKEKDKIESGIITVSNINGDYKFSYKDINVKVDTNSVINEIKKYNKNLGLIDKIKFIKSNKKNKTFYLKGLFEEKDIDNFMDILVNKLNTSVRSDGIVVDDDYNVYYDKGVDGFILDYDKTREKITKELGNLKEENHVKAKGNVVKHDVNNASLALINKKVSSYTTYFENSGNRGHNITLASSRLNNTVLMPNETFSYLKSVGPYSASNGYLPAPIYLNGQVSTANGGGVCQLTSTLYMAQLKAGLKTIVRYNHIFAPTYVPKGLDATVYSTTTDFKFKNQYEYPVYIVSYVKGNYLTVDIWSNENALGGKTYEPYSVASNGGWLSYLKIIEDGKVIETKYLDRSVYKSH